MGRSKRSRKSKPRKPGNRAVRVLVRLTSYLVALILVGAITATAGTLFVFYKFGRDLPDYTLLATYQPKVMTRVHAADGSLLTEYAREHRVFVPVSAMPKMLVQAFLSAEDKTFFEHPGVNPFSIIRAGLTNLANMGQGRRPVGASTITQQVAKNFLLTNEVSYERKIKEAILSLRIERALTKERILELYLNEIYLGEGAYGVAAAALNYFNKSLDTLSLSEIAFLAAVPKAPSNYHPVRNQAAAKARRNWVLGRMAEDGVIARAEAHLAGAGAVTMIRRDKGPLVQAAYFNEEVRRFLYDRYGEDGLYEGGLSVRTTLDPRLQDIARRQLRAGLIAYDRRHGWRGPLASTELTPNWPRVLEEFKAPPGRGVWRKAIVLDIQDESAEVGLVSGAHGFINLKELLWARPWVKGQKIGAKVKHPSNVLAVGDIVLVETLEGDPAALGLRQIPDIQGAIVAMDPHTGRVHAMVGGFSFESTEFNRATQARRQPGSAFKPFVYAAALENGFTPASIVLDAPFVIDQGPGLGKWKPANYTNKFYGPSTLRLGLEKSRNLMTVRLAQYLGMETVSDFAIRFGIVDEMPPILSMALGAGETTLMRLTAGYAMLVNGGKRIEPTLIDRIQDRRGRTVVRHDERACPGCSVLNWRRQSEPKIPDNRLQVVEAVTAYQMVSMLEGVVQRGTGIRVRKVGRPLAGKTGTTNKSLDTWFVGFSPDLAVGVYVGFDQPKTLGRLEQGASAAAPIFRDFMAEALADSPQIPFRIPKGVRLVRVAANTGLLAQPGDRAVILEAFRPGTEPDSESGPVLDGTDSFGAQNQRTGDGVSGLY